MEGGEKMARTLKEWRAHMDMTQQQFAEKIGVSASTYNQWENNPHSIKVGNVLKLSKALDVPPQDIIFFENESYFKYEKERNR